MPVWLHHYRKSQFNKGDDLQVKHPLVRRLTSLQLGVVDALLQFQLSRPDLWQEFCNDENIQIFYSTKLGEIDTSISLTQQVLSKDYPLSPKDFQNSVYNAAIGAASVIFDFHNGYTACSDGFLSREKSILLAFNQIESRECTAALIIHSQAWSSSTAIHSETEVCYLAASQAIAGEAAEHRISAVQSLCEVDFSSMPPLLVRETEDSAGWLDWDQYAGVSRAAIDRTGEGVLIEW